MAMKITPYQRPFTLPETTGATRSQANGAPAFGDLLAAELGTTANLTVSKHAAQRLHSRGIQLSPETLTKIGDAVDKAAAKGSRETLVLTDEAALVVAVKDRTVVTVFERDHLKEGIVTSIDSAVIV